MARPRSEDKQQALLRSATEVFAAQGLSAPTALIARQAGVAEGTLFRYFPTKDALFGSVFEHLVTELEDFLAQGHDPSLPLKVRTQVLWERYIDWGVHHPTAYATLNQLAVSGKLTREQLECASRLCADVDHLSDKVVFEGLDAARSSEFCEALMTAIANATVGFVVARPEAAAAYKAAGFDLVWKAFNPKE